MYGYIINAKAMFDEKLCACIIYNLLYRNCLKIIYTNNSKLIADLQ